MANVNIGRKSGFIKRSGVMRRESLWGSWDTVQTTLSGAPTAAITNSLNATALALRPFTIVRFRGWMHVVSDQIAATETYIGDVAMAVVSEQASALGVTAVPTPLTDKGSDLFFVYEQLGTRLQFADATGFINNGVSKEIDSKAMRKVNGDQDVVMVVENEIAGCVITTTGRFLVKLH